MEDFYTFLFRGFGYTLFGLFLEVWFAVTGIELALGVKLEKQTPHKYLEGFTSLYMIPVHWLGMFYGFEALHGIIADWHWFFRYIVWCFGIAGTEALVGFVYHKTLGFYSWDYYKLSKYKVFKEGYTLWTLIPLWGIAGMILEQYSKLLIFLTPYFHQYLK